MQITSVSLFLLTSIELTNKLIEEVIETPSLFDIYLKDCFSLDSCNIFIFKGIDIDEPLFTMFGEWLNVL